MAKLKLLFVMLLIAASGYTQDPHFSLINELPVYINPANTALSSDFRVSSCYRNQWSSISNPYETFGINADFRFKQNNWKEMSGRTILEKIQKNGGLGISVIRDKAGDLGFGTTNAMITLGSSVALSQNSVLGIGIGTGLLQYSVDFTTANWGNGNTSNETNLISKQSFADLAAGVTWKYGRGESYISANDEFKALIGFSISHLTSPKIQFYNNYVDKLYWKMNFHGTFLISVPNSRINFTPAYLLSKQGPSTEFIFGTHVRYRIKEASRYTGFIKESQAYAGLFYRAGDALITQVGIDLGSVSLCFSYDFNISRLTPATNMLGSLEFGIRFNSPNPFLYQAKSY